MKNNSKIPSKAEIKRLYESYVEYFTIVMENIIDILHAEVHLSAAPTYKSRVKSFNSYYKKILRLKPEETKGSESLVLLTDMMGIRMICAFIEDMQLGLEQIKKVFDIKEIEVKGAEKKFSEFGYESIHVLIKIPDSCKPPIELFQGLAPLGDNLVCEIQIRTILQDAWAEVEHELIYKTEFNPLDTPLRRKLASLNAMLTLADITFQEIRDYQNRIQKELEERRHSFYDIADNLIDEKPKETEEKDINRFTPHSNGTIDEMLLQALHDHNNGNLDEAIKIYSKILEAINPNDKNIIAVIRKHRGMAYFSMNNFDAALQDFDISLQYDPKAFRTYYYKGIVCAIQKNYEWAIQNYTKSLEINEFQAHTYFRRAMAYFEIQEYEKSMNDLNNALNLGMPPADCKVLQEKLTKQFGLDV